MSGAGPIVVLTGAGISRESGLATFRDGDGIWARVRIEDVATPEAFAANPGRVHDFYNARRRQLLAGDVASNAAHAALAQLERDWPDEVLVVTQNIDDLHERAGSRSLIHMHGELLKARCLYCAAIAACTDDLGVETPCGTCGRRGGMRPHVVWFGEMPLEMDRIAAALRACGLFVSIGTSGSVYPAAGFIRELRAASRHTVELNLERSEGARLFDEGRYGPATQIVPAFVAQLLAQR